MATSKTGLANIQDEATRAEVATRTEVENLPTLFGRLGDDVMHLVDTKLTLLKVEIKEEANAYVRSGVLMMFGGIIAAIGFALVNIAVAFGISTLFSETNFSQGARYALGFVITGLLYLTIGGLVVLAMKNRLAKRDPLPDRTVEELRKDKQWLKNRL